MATRARGRRAPSLASAAGDAEAGDAKAAAAEARRSGWQMNQLLAHSAVHWFAIILRMQAENELWLLIYNGDFAAQARTVGSTRSAAAALGFLLTPVFAGLTDAFGRKPVLMLASVVSIVQNLMVALSPTRRNLIISTAMSTLTMSSWELASQSMIADIFNATPDAKSTTGAAAALGGALSKLQMMPSCCSIICPVLGGALAAISLRLPFAIQAVLCVLNSVALLWLPESHPKNERVAFTWK